MKRITIYDIKYLTQDTAPYFFTRESLRFFGQTMKSFSVIKQIDGRIKIAAIMKDRHSGRTMGVTVRYFNPINNELERN